MLNWSFNRSLVTADASDPGGPSMNDMSHIPPAAQPRKSKIALALGGGAARGWAHIGVLRALDEEGIDVGMIAGTSIGALVGGCYLAGKLDELETFARSLTMRRIASLLDFTIRGSGLFGGMRLTKRMQEHLENLSIEELDRPFVAVATEVNSGHEVWINSGSLITAIRASYACPAFSSRSSATTGPWWMVRWSTRCRFPSAGHTRSRWSSPSISTTISTAARPSSNTAPASRRSMTTGRKTVQRAWG
jgi:NTE family protein